MGLTCAGPASTPARKERRWPSAELTVQFLMSSPTSSVRTESLSLTTRSRLAWPSVKQWRERATSSPAKLRTYTSIVTTITEQPTRQI